MAKQNKILCAEAEIKQNINEVDGGSGTFDLNAFLSMMSRKSGGGGNDIFLFPTIHTVSFHQFLSGLEWIINLEFCLLKVLIFYQKLL